MLYLFSPIGGCIMKLFCKSLFFVIPMLLIVSCEGGDSSSDDSSDLTSSELNTILELLVDAMNDSGGGSSKTSSIDVNQSVEHYKYSYSTTCNDTHYWFTAAVSDTYPCPTSGHVTYSGNLKTFCSSWMYHTNHTTYCVCNGDWHTQNSLTFQYSDPTNNLYDCESGGIIVDGTVYINASGTGTVINISITGTLGINRRGPTGGLVPITSDCSIFLYYNGTSGEWSGTICGHIL